MVTGNPDNLRQMIGRFAPFMMILSLVMVTGGAALMLYFGYAVYELLANPEQSVFMNYILSNMPYPYSDIYTINGTYDGREFTIALPTGAFFYARYGLAFVLWLIVGSIVSQLISAGMKIFKVLNLNKEELINADTRNSHNAS